MVAAHKHGRLAAAPLLVPYQQGEFSGLCSIYAAIGGLRLLLQPYRPLTYQECAGLYKRGINLLALDDALPFAVTWGVSQTRWRRIITALCASTSRIVEFGVSSATPFPENRRHDRATVFATIEAAINRQQPVLVALRGAYNHYSVICAYSSDRFELHDSYGYHWISRRTCGVTLDSGKWRHRIATRSLIILEAQP